MSTVSQIDQLTHDGALFDDVPIDVLRRLQRPRVMAKHVVGGPPDYEYNISSIYPIGRQGGGFSVPIPTGESAVRPLTGCITASLVPALKKHDFDFRIEDEAADKVHGRIRHLIQSLGMAHAKYSFVVLFNVPADLQHDLAGDFGAHAHTDASYFFHDTMGVVLNATDEPCPQLTSLESVNRPILSLLLPTLGIALLCMQAPHRRRKQLVDDEDISMMRTAIDQLKEAEESGLVRSICVVYHSERPGPFSADLLDGREPDDRSNPFATPDDIFTALAAGHSVLPVATADGDRGFRCMHSSQGVQPHLVQQMDKFFFTIQFTIPCGAGGD